MEKTALRQRLINQLVTLATKQQEEQLLYQQMFALPQWQQAQRVALTISQKIELDTRPLIEAAWAAGKTVYVPKVMPQRQMVFLPYTAETELIKSKFGLFEPAYVATKQETDFDLLLVPGLAFSAAGERLGFGGGYYDRFLAKYSPQTVSLALSPQYYPVAEWSVEPFDILVDQVISVSR